MYITDDELAGFDSYKYSSIDTSPLSNYVMHPFWNQFVKIFPKWVAPNLMTFSGFLLLVLQTAVLTFYDPYWYASASEFTEYPPIPAWVWWLCVFTQFFSHTLDGCDGKQARRTGSSSPMGELFDHGIDSWCVSMFAFGIYSIFGRGECGASAWQFYAVLWMLMTCFLLCHWEKYNTGILYLPWSYDFSQVVMALAYAMCAFFGTEIWRADIYGIKIREYILVILYASGILFSMPVCFYNVYRSYVDKTGKMRSMYEAFIPLFSSVIVFVLFTTWCFFSPGNILHQSPRWMLTAVGVILSNIVCRLIVSQMSNSRCQVFNFLIMPLLCAVSVSLFFGDATIESWCLKILTVSLVLLHIHYGVVVVDQLAEHLGIRVFSITKKLKKHKE
ncbi:ethanolaminephosphotransferase 1-like [Styela clava]